MKMPDLHPQQAFSSSQSHTHTPPPPSPTSTLLSPLPVSGSSPLHMQMGAGANRQRRGVAGGPVIKVDLLPVKWQPAHHLDAARLAPVSSSLSLSLLSLHRLPQLIEIVGRINVTSSTCVHEFSRFFWRLCRTFGKIFTNTKVRVLVTKR